jgi:hypothetical protein
MACDPPVSLCERFVNGVVVQATAAHV